MTKTTADGSTLVNPTAKWIPIDPANPPKSRVKMQLINKALGTATIGYYEEGQFTHYAGLPTFAEDSVEPSKAGLMEPQQ